MEFHSRRSSVLGQHGCVASSNPLASQAGLGNTIFGLITVINSLCKNRQLHGNMCHLG